MCIIKHLIISSLVIENKFIVLVERNTMSVNSTCTVQFSLGIALVIGNLYYKLDIFELNCLHLQAIILEQLFPP
jgi:hypothetical protein